MTDVYSIECKLYLHDGTEVDISSEIRRLIYIHSTKLKIPIIKILVSNQILKYIYSDILLLSFIVSYKSFTKGELTQYYTFNADLYQHKQSLLSTQENINEPYRNYIWLTLINKELYDISKINIPSKIYFNTTLNSVLRSFGLQVPIITDIDEDIHIDQLYIPTSNLESVLEYISYWYNPEKSYSIVYYYDPLELTQEIRIRDIKKRFQEGLFDKKILVTMHDTVRGNKEELEGNTVSIQTPVQIENKLPEFVRYEKIYVLEKPSSYLYNLDKIPIKEFFDQYVPVDLELDLKEDMVNNVNKEPLVISGPYSKSLINKISNDYRHSVSLSLLGIQFKEPFFIFASDIINLEIDDPNMLQYQGLWYIDLVKYDFKFSSGIWTLTTNIYAERGNYLRR